MGYLEKFARNRRIKENTTVLTARLPESLYGDFKGYCDDLGLSISEAVCLLVEREMVTLQGESETALAIEYKTSDDVFTTNTDEHNEIVKSNTDKHKVNTNVVKKHANTSKANTKRFTTKPFEVNNKLPCPICGEWKSASNFSRHAKDEHGSTTEDIFTNEEYKEKVKAMIQEKGGNQGLY